MVVLYIWMLSCRSLRRRRSRRSKDQKQFKRRAPREAASPCLASLQRCVRSACISCL